MEEKNIIEALQQLRDDIQAWTTVNLLALQDSILNITDQLSNLNLNNLQIVNSEGHQVVAINEEGIQTNNISIGSIDIDESLATKMKTTAETYGGEYENIRVIYDGEYETIGGK